jgi:hypothetical protein
MFLFILQKLLHDPLNRTPRVVQWYGSLENQKPDVVHHVYASSSEVGMTPFLVIPGSRRRLHANLHVAADVDHFQLHFLKTIRPTTTAAACVPAAAWSRVSWVPSAPLPPWS